MTENQKQALQYFSEGYSCAQAVAMAYAEKLGLTTAQAALVMGTFGGGIARLRQNCGAYTALMMLTASLTTCDAMDANLKAEAYPIGQIAHQAFLEKVGTINCGELLGRVAEMPVPEERSPEYYAKRPCAKVVLAATQVYEDLLAERG